MIVRGKLCLFRRHALDGRNAERPPIRIDDAAEVLEEPQHDDGSQATRWKGNRTIIVYYREEANAIVVRGVSATRRRVFPRMP